MGGDGGPQTTIEGVSIASKLYPEVKFKLYGDKTKSVEFINKFDLKSSIEFVHTKEFIKPDDQPVNALRKLKKKSSIRLATNDVKEKKCNGLVSAGIQEHLWLFQSLY